MIRTLPRLRTTTPQDDTRVSWAERWGNLFTIWSGARLQQKQHDEIRLVAVSYQPSAEYVNDPGTNRYVKVIRKAK